MENVILYKTHDFYNACILRASGIPLKTLQKESHKLVVFIFDSPAEVCEQIINRHWDRSLKLESRLLIETINELKSRVHEKLREV